MAFEAFPSLAEPLSEFTAAVRDHFVGRRVAVRLFGSYARGEAREDSDVDVVVIVEGPLKHADRVWPMGLAGELGLRYQLVITAVVLTETELEFLRQRRDAFAVNLDREGVAA